MSARHWAVAARAATRLAMIYSAGVLFLAAIVIWLLGGLLPPVSVPLLATAGLVVGFGALAVARRFGFLVLWSLLLILWLPTIREGIVGANGDLLVWTVLAMPLYVVSIIGFTSRPVSSLRLEILITVTGWVLVVVVAIRGGIYVDAPADLPLTWDNYVCAVWPFLVAGREIIRTVAGLRHRVEINSSTSSALNTVND